MKKYTEQLKIIGINLTPIRKGICLKRNSKTSTIYSQAESILHLLHSSISLVRSDSAPDVVS